VGGSGGFNSIPCAHAITPGDWGSGRHVGWAQSTPQDKLANHPTKFTGWVVRNSRSELRAQFTRCLCVIRSDQSCCGLATTTQPGVAALRAPINNKQHNQASRVGCCAFVRSEHAASSARGAGFVTPEEKNWDPRPPSSKMSPKQGPRNEGPDPEAAGSTSRGGGCAASEAVTCFPRRSKRKRPVLSLGSSSSMT
jgi:hypothetical protein